MYNAYTKERRKTKVIPGTYDLMFKAIMTSQREYLADIVSGISGIDKEKIMKDAVIKSSEYVIENIEESKKTSDLIIEVKNNIINIEMNNFKYPKLNLRNNKYLYKLVSISKDNSKIIQINIDNFDNGNDEISKYVLYDIKNNKEDEDSIIKYKVNLALIRKKYYNNEELSKLEKELLLLTIDDKKELETISKGDRIMNKVNKKINELSDDKYLCMMYDREEFKNWEREEYTKYQIETGIKKGIEDGIKKGIEQGIEQGIEKGIEQGIEQGKKDNTISIAKVMIDRNMDIKDISEITGLSIEEVENLI